MQNTSIPLLQRLWRTARPWLASLGLVLFLRYTGALGLISNGVGTLLLKTGAMNASTDAPPVIHRFPYNFNLRDLQGNTISVEHLRGKTLFINMWATWCGPCRIEMPSIEALYQDTDTSRVAFLLISVDEPDQQRKVTEFVREKGFTFPVYTPVGPLPEILRVPSIPTTFIVAPDGRIVMRETGLANYHTRKVRRLLESL